MVEFATIGGRFTVGTTPSQKNDPQIPLVPDPLGEHGHD